MREVPSEGNWLHEMKFDGYRIQAHLKNNFAALYTRTGLNWSNTFPHILESVGKLDATNAIFDGEIVALDEKGRPHFQMLQNTLKSKQDTHLRYYVFDLLYLDGRDLRNLPLIERKKLLKNLLKRGPENIIYSEAFDQGEDFYRVSCEHELEGIVSKLADSPYRSGRNDLWAKTKCSARQEFVIGGFSDAKGGRIGLGALLLGVYEKGKLRYVGRVGTGFDVETLKDLKNMLTPLIQNQSPFALNAPKEKGIHWVKPLKVAEVSFSQWTNEGVLRTPVFMGLREDKPARVIQEEKLREVSSGEKILYQKEKITKKEVAEFYHLISSAMLPYVKDRPLSVVRCPEGTEKTCFYQKHITGTVPAALYTGEDFLAIDSSRGLRELAQMNAFEMHAWNCHRQTIKNPDQIVMDFDPGPEVPWEEVVNAAFELKRLLEILNLKSFVKLTGGKGLHVHIPIAPIYSWELVKSFSQTLALQMVSMKPTLYTANMSKGRRQKKIFIDYLRNGYGATAVAPYSLRAKAISSVAMPLDWKELRKVKSSHEYTLRNALKKIKNRKIDPWKGMLKLEQRISILDQQKKSQVA